MNLADEIIAARGTDIDLGGCITSLSAGIAAAQRFVLSDDVTMAAYQLIKSKPSSLLDAMPLCRLPYQSIWFEWNGGLSTRAGWDKYPSTEKLDHSINRPEPLRMGCLVEGDGQRGTMTWAWVHRASGVNVCGIGVVFDWTLDGDASEAVRATLSGRTDTLGHLLYNKWANPAMYTDDAIVKLMADRKGWNKLTNDPQQREAVRCMVRHEIPWLSRHGLGLIEILLDRNPQNLPKLLAAWEGDIAGECPVIAALVLMLNSRNAVDHEPVDLGKLNKARLKRGKQPLLSHTVTKLHLSNMRSRAGVAAGYSREQMRQHLVMGHFKVRKSGVYWWNPFLRGDATRPLHRKQYDVEPAQ